MTLLLIGSVVRIRDSKQTSAFCHAYDQATPKIKAQLQSVRTDLDAQGLALDRRNTQAGQLLVDDAGAGLKEVHSELQALTQAAPHGIKKDFEFYVNSQEAPQDQKDLPSQKAKYDRAERHVDSFVKAKCGFEPAL